MAAHRLQRRLGTAKQRGDRLLGAFGPVGRLRQQLEVGEERLGRRRGEGRAVDHDEILRAAPGIGQLGIGQALTRDPDHLQRQPARQGDSVVEDVACIGREPKYRLVGAGMREQALRQFGRQAVGNDQRTPGDAMALGVDRADAMAIILRGRVEDRLELFDQT